jgi:hypothetical protein
MGKMKPDDPARLLLVLPDYDMSNVLPDYDTSNVVVFREKQRTLTQPVHLV